MPDRVSLFALPAVGVEGVAPFRAVEIDTIGLRMISPEPGIAGLPGARRKSVGGRRKKEKPRGLVLPGFGVNRWVPQARTRPEQVPGRNTLQTRTQKTAPRNTRQVRK